MNKQTLEDLIKDCPCDHEKWCFLKEIVESSGLTDYMAEQVRLVYTLKFLKSSEAGHDVGKQVAWEAWVDEGYAAKYREIYVPGMTHEELKYKIFIEKSGGL